MYIQLQGADSKARLPLLFFELKEKGDPCPHRDVPAEDPESGGPEGGCIQPGRAAAPLNLGVFHPSRLYGHEDDRFPLLPPLAGEERVDGDDPLHD